MWTPESARNKAETTEFIVDERYEVDAAASAPTAQPATYTYIPKTAATIS